MNIRDKVAVVTGGGSGIGEAAARELAVRGAKTVALVDVSDGVHAVAAKINQETGRTVAVGFVGDVRSDEFRASVFDALIAGHGLPRICVPAAGITRDAIAVKVNKETGRPELYPIEKFRLVIDINLTAPIYWAIEMLGRIAADRAKRGLKRWEPTEDMEGAIVFIGSVSSKGNKGQVGYSATKAGLVGAAATLRKEGIFHGVRCNVLHPGFTDTPMVRAMGPEIIDKGVLPFTQLRRLIKPEEIADAICFLITNSAVSGELWADGGWHPPA